MRGRVFSVLPASRLAACAALLLLANFPSLGRFTVAVEELAVRLVSTIVTSGPSLRPLTAVRAGIDVVDGGVSLTGVCHTVENRGEHAVEATYGDSCCDCKQEGLAHARGAGPTNLLGLSHAGRKPIGGDPRCMCVLGGVRMRFGVGSLGMGWVPPSGRNFPRPAGGGRYISSRSACAFV